MSNGLATAGQDRNFKTYRTKHLTTDYTDDADGVVALATASANLIMGAREDTRLYTLCAVNQFGD
jgi:hypothetical protein